MSLSFYVFIFILFFTNGLYLPLQNQTLALTHPNPHVFKAYT